MIDGSLFGRRSFILGSGALLASAAVANSPTPNFDMSEIKQIEAQLGGRVGIAALDTGSGARLSYRGHERFAMCSTFKWMLVAALLRRVDQGSLSFDRRLSYSAGDLLDYAPVTRSHLAEGSLTVGDLCGAVIELSDNTAANLLLGLLGGPAALTDFLRSLGDGVTRLDRTETSLNSNLPGDERDTTTPEAMMPTMTRILTGDVLSPDNRAKLITWMKNCQTGLEKLRAGLPADWIVGDKTGSGAHGANNDSAILWPPGRPPILVAAYLSGSVAPPQALSAAHAKLGSIVARRFA